MRPFFSVLDALQNLVSLRDHTTNHLATDIVIGR
ncbi:hypothetical protein PGPR2_00330 [Pseudomonas aeruginosa PGPR2]|nr:hypothetical protein PGPR2_00330 [Pseudomonas aeruginosa PGPR2]